MNKMPLTRVSSKQRNIFVGSNRKKTETQSVSVNFRVFFCETNKLFFRFVSVFQTRFETIETNRFVSKKTGKEQNKTAFEKCMISNLDTVPM
jgi:hypothetical protein